MRTVRQILLTEYTGVIVVAVLIADSFSALFMTVAEQISYHVYFAEHNLPRDGHRLSITYSILSTGTRIALYLITAYLLAGWLYPAKAQSSVLGETAQTRSENRGTNVTERGTIPGILQIASTMGSAGHRRVAVAPGCLVDHSFRGRAFSHVAAR